MITIGINMTKERYANTSNLELFIIHAAKYMELYPNSWHEHGQESMVSYVMYNTKGSMNPHALRDQVNRLYASVGIE